MNPWMAFAIGVVVGVIVSVAIITLTGYLFYSGEGN
jgi:hypothetical protein